MSYGACIYVLSLHCSRSNSTVVAEPLCIISALFLKMTGKVDSKGICIRYRPVLEVLQPLQNYAFTFVRIKALCLRFSARKGRIVILDNPLLPISSTSPPDCKGDPGVPLMSHPARDKARESKSNSSSLRCPPTYVPSHPPQTSYFLEQDVWRPP